MSPEQRQIKELQEQVKKLTDFMLSLENAAQIAPNVQRALSATITKTSNKAASSENQAVSEAGAGSYSVLKPPDRFVRLGDNYLPAYDA